jgi:hypothetical protein
MFLELLCITNPELLSFNGDYYSDLSTGIYISFNECENLTGKTNNNCMSKDDKKKWLNTPNRWINFVTIQNSKSFNMTEYNGKKVIVGESFYTDRPLSYANRFQYFS